MLKQVYTVAALTLMLSFPAFADVTVQSPYVRAMPPGQMMTGAFMALNNSDAEVRAVVSATSSVAEIVELHTHEHKDGMMQMRQVSQIDIDAGATTLLQPGGLHVMLINVKRQLIDGDAVDLTLVLDNGEKIVLTAPVKSVVDGMKHEMKTN